MSTKKYKKHKLSKKNTTRRHKQLECVAVLNPDKSIPKNTVHGIVEFLQRPKHLDIKYKIYNLSNGEHGFHIHKCGDLTKGCSSGCSHFNPENCNHGGLNSKKCHAGDLGNIKSKDGLSQGTIRTNKITLRKSIRNIIGRMIIVHADRDDLGKGGDEESLKTGNAGKRLSCGVIGIRND
jgi:superoxide dismutase, Cu-Zn family